MSTEIVILTSILIGVVLFCTICALIRKSIFLAWVAAVALVLSTSEILTHIHLH